MAQELILLADVEGLGTQGSVVKVAEGYARNFLLPHKLAATVTSAAMKKIGKLRKAREEEILKETEAARALVAKIEKASVSIPMKVGEGEKLFGSVTGADIAVALQAQGLEIDKHKIHLEEPIRELGVFNVAVKLTPQVQATLKVWVVEE